MEFTGKNKSNFIDHYQRLVLKPKSTYPKFEQLENLPLSMQFGVVQDYADSIGYPIETYIWYCMDDDTNYYGAECRYQNVSHYKKTRDEARLSAIKAFDEIVNRDTRKVKHKK